SPCPPSAPAKGRKLFGTAVANHGSFAAACREALAQFACARRRARPASSRTDDAIAGDATSRPPTAKQEKRPHIKPETSSSGSTRERRRTPAYRPARSTHRCCSL